MATKNILVHLGDDPETNLRMDVAVDACKHFGAHLTALYMHEVKIPVGAVGRGGYLAENQEKVQKYADALRQRVGRLCKQAGVDWEWAGTDSEHFETVFRYTSLSDLIILSHITIEDLEDRIFFKQLEELIIRAGAPILVLPSEYKRSGPPGYADKILIAWKPSGEAIRAVRDTLDMIRSASEVTVFTADDSPDNPNNPSEGILRYLKSHDIEAKSEHHIEDSRIGDQIVNVAVEQGAELIIMGAYGRSGLAEKLLGGATWHIITRCPLPVLLSH